MAKSLSFYNLTGGLNTVQDLFTINSTPNRTESPDMKNVEFFKLGGIKRMEGNKQFGQTFYDLTDNTKTVKITCGCEYTKGNETYHTITLSDGRCMIYNKTTHQFELIYKFDTATKRHSICKYSNGLVFTNGVDNMIYYEKDRDLPLDGTVAGTQGEYKLIGTNTSFLKTLQIGDIFTIDTMRFIVTQVVNDTTVEILQEKDGVFDSPVLETFTDKTIKLTPITIIPAELVNTTEDTTMEPRPINGLAIASYKGRLWVGGNDGVLYYSELGLVSGWDIKYDAGAFAGFNEDASNFTALGIWDKYLVCHKFKGTYLVDANNDDSTKWSVEPYSTMTCFSQQSFTTNSNGYFIYDKDTQAIYPLLSRSIYNSVYLGKSITDKIQNVFDMLEYTKLDETFVVYEPKKQYLMFYMNFMDGNGYSNKCYIFNQLTKCWIYRELPNKVTAAYTIDSKLFIGTDDGKVLEEFEGETFDGQPIEFYWTSPSYVWGGGTNKTTTREFRVKYLEDHENKFNVETIVDDKITGKKRYISDDRDNGETLVWENNYQEEDFAYIKNPYYRYVYKYTGSDGKTYYSRRNALINSNVDMYYNEELTQYADKNQNLEIVEDSDILNYNRLDYQKQDAYGWLERNYEYKCFKAQDEKYNQLRVWVNDNDKTKGVRNSTGEYYKESTIKYYMYLGINGGTPGNVTNAYLFPSKDPEYEGPGYIILGSETNTSNKFGLNFDESKINEMLNNGEIALCYRTKGNNTFIATHQIEGRFYTEECYNEITLGPNKLYPGNTTCTVKYYLGPNGWTWTQPSGSNYTVVIKQYSASIYKTTSYPIWNNSIFAYYGEDVQVEDYKEDISIAVQGVIYYRYPDGDYGKNLSEPYFAKKEYPEVGDFVYSDDMFQNQLYKITETSPNNIVIDKGFPPGVLPWQPHNNMQMQACLINNDTGNYKNIVSGERFCFNYSKIYLTNFSSRLVSYLVLNNLSIGALYEFTIKCTQNFNYPQGRGLVFYLRSDISKNETLPTKAGISKTFQFIATKTQETIDFGGESDELPYGCSYIPYYCQVFLYKSNEDKRIKATAYRSWFNDTYNMIPQYYLATPVALTFIERIRKLFYYIYPNILAGRELTNTVWADGIRENIQLKIQEVKSTLGNLWRKLGYRTKRFILGNQYFETVKYKFYGNDINENICIAGFEVDGIQLTEVPY